jgi:hypothetical protein
VLIALPGQRGEKYDFIDLYRASGPDGVRQCIANAVLFQPTREEQEDYNKCTTRETELKRINRLYPLPPLLGLHCEYRFTDDARIWLHRLKCFIGGEETGERCAVWEPVSSPFGGIVALIKPGARAAFGLRVHVSSPDGGTNAIDFLRGELFLLAASEVRAALANAGLATANGGESTVIEICKQAQPDRCITVATALGWQADSDISFVDFGDGRW